MDIARLAIRNDFSLRLYALQPDIAADTRNFHRSRLNLRDMNIVSIHGCLYGFEMHGFRQSDGQFMALPKVNAKPRAGIAVITHRQHPIHNLDIIAVVFAIPAVDADAVAALLNADIVAG